MWVFKPTIFFLQKSNFRLANRSMAEENFQDILKQFGAHLASVRKHKQLSLRKLATNCNIDWSDISKYERGEINISLKTVAELAKGLDVSVKELLNF